MAGNKNDIAYRLREILTEDDIERIEKSYKESRKTTPCEARTNG